MVSLASMRIFADAAWKINDFSPFILPPPIPGAQFLNGSTYDDVQAFEWLGLIPKNLTDDHNIAGVGLLGMEDF